MPTVKGAVERGGHLIGRRRNYRRVWLDVGAHEGQLTLHEAAYRRRLLVYAFEPDLATAARLMGRLANYVVVPFAVAESDGTAPFHRNAFSASSSLLPLDEAVRDRWVGGGNLVEVETFPVPTIRLDSFLGRAGVDRVEWLKVDAQGTDLEVVRSLGERIGDVDRITIEVATGENLYLGAASRQETVDFLTANGFELVASEAQTFGQEENLTFVNSGSSGR